MTPTFEWINGLFPKGGYFVEAGAHDGVGDSQTKELEDTGLWTGLCIEPSSAFRGLESCVKKGIRHCKIDNRCLWISDGGTVNFREVKGEAIELSGIDGCFGDSWDRESRPHGFVQKQAVTLTTMLDEHNAPRVIEFLSLDTEGSEFEILCGLDFTKRNILAMQVEHNGVLTKRMAVTRLLSMNGYNMIGTDEINDRFELQ